MALTRPRSRQLLDSDYKDSVRAATTENIDLSAAPNTIDNVSLSKRDRILVKNQSLANQNGIYYIQTLGSGNNGVWVRASDFANDQNVSSGLQVTVEEGTINGNRTFQLTTDNPIDLEVTLLTFEPVSGSGLDDVTDIGNTTTNSITVGGITVNGVLKQSATLSPSTPAANVMVTYVTASGTSPDRVITSFMKNEAGEEIIISSVIV
jgi:phage-related tail fiber protein